MRRELLGRRLGPPRLLLAGRPQLGARALGPSARAEALERLQRLLQRLAGIGALARAAQALAEAQQRAGALERHRQALVERERGLELRAHLVVGRHQGAQPSDGGLRPARAGLAAARLEDVDQRLRLVTAACARVGLDEIGRAHHQRRLHAEPVGRALRVLEHRDRLRDPPQPELEQPERGGQVGAGGVGLEAGDEREPLGHVAPAVLLLAAGGLDVGERREAVREQRRLPGVLRELDRLGGARPAPPPSGRAGSPGASCAASG